MNKLMKAIMAVIVVSAAHSASAETVVVVSAKSSVSSMSVDQVTQVFLGRSASMNPIDQADNAIRSEFYKKVTEKEVPQVKAIWARLVFTGKASMPQEVASSADVKKALAADPKGVGYIDKAAVDGSVKVVMSVQQ